MTIKDHQMMVTVKAQTRACELSVKMAMGMTAKEDKTEVPYPVSAP